jgi:hypothetical protein
MLGVLMSTPPARYRNERHSRTPGEMTGAAVTMCASMSDEIDLDVIPTDPDAAFGEPVEALPEPVEALPVLVEARPLPAPAPAALPAVQAAAVAATGFVAGAATLALVRRHTARRLARRSAPRRAVDMLPIVGSRTFIVDVHMLAKPGE